MISFFTYRPPYMPQEVDMYLSQWRKQMYDTKNVTDREDLGFLCSSRKRLAKFCDMTEEQQKAFLSFAKKQKVPWQFLVMVFNTDLQSKVHLVVGYNIPSYMLAFLRRVDIPVADLTDESIKELLKNNIFCESPMEFARYVVQKHSRNPNAEHLAYDSEKNQFYLTQSFE